MVVLIVMPLLPESVHSASHAGWEDGNEVTTTNHLTGTHSSVTNRSSWSSNRNSHLQTLRPTPIGVQLERKEEEEEEKRKKNNHRLLTLNAEFTANDDDKEKSLFLSPADSSTRDPTGFTAWVVRLVMWLCVIVTVWVPEERYQHQMETD